MISSYRSSDLRPIGTNQLCVEWTRCRALALLFTLFICSRGFAQDCRTIAAAPPMLTLGGPATVKPGESEALLAATTDATLFQCTHKPDLGWFTGWRRGLTDRWDVGVDFVSLQHNDKSTASAKITARYRVSKRLRLEAGFGGADDSEGKTLNADFGITTGTLHQGPRNYFASVRIAAARGYPGNVCCFGEGKATDNNIPPDNYRILGSVGSTMRISENAKLLYQFGFGGVLAHFADRSDTGRIVSFSVGLQFNFHKTHGSTDSSSP